MKRTMLVCAFVPSLAFAAAAPKTPEAIWSGALEAGRSKIVSQAPPKLTPIHMTIDRGAGFEAVVTERDLGINVDISRSGSDFWLNGYLKTNARAFDRRSTLAGVSVMGGGVNVDLRPFGDLSYILSGPYKDADGKDGSLNLRLDVLGRPVRDMSIHEKGLDLYLSWNGGGYEITGKADPARYGKRELAIIGASVATLTWDVFGR